MPKSKEEIYNMLSPNILKRKKRRAKLARKVSKEVPPIIDNSIVCGAQVARSLNVQPTQPEPLLISPKEGKQAVNGQAEKLDIRPMKKEMTVDQGVAAIPLQEKKKPGRPRKEKKTSEE